MIPRSRLYRAAVLGVLLPLAAFAQDTSDQNPKKHEKHDKPDEVVLLSPFVVTTDPNSYTASESVTGSRVATSIKDLPYTVNVITSEFMNDFDFFDVASDMAYTSSLTGLDTQGNYSLRGYGATFQLRNGFYRLGLIDRVNVDRVEVIKGPNAAIYGQTSPAGMVNIITKRPNSRESEKFTFTAGDFNMQRGELNVNTPLGSLGGVKLYNLVSVSGTNRTYDTPYAYLHQRLFSDALLAEINPQSTLLLEIEWSKRMTNPATSQLPFEYNNATKTYSAVTRPDLATFGQEGPNAQQNRELTTVTLTYENRLSDIWSLRASTYEFHRHAFNFNSGSVDKFDPGLGQFIRGNTLKDTLNEDVAALQADLLAHYWTAGHRMENKTLFTFDVSSNWRYRIQTQPNSKLYPIPNISLANPNYSLPPDDAFTIVTRRDHVRWNILGLFLRQQTTMLNGRLIAFAGARYDQVTYDLNFGDVFNTGGSSPGSLKTPGTKDYFVENSVTTSLGTNFKLTKENTLYANHSTSFYPNAQLAKLGDPRLPAETGKGWDYGLKSSHFNDQLVLTLGGFYIVRDGVKVKVANTGSIDDTQAAGSQVAKGVELDFTWKATDQLTLLGGYGLTNARITANGTNTDSIGRRPPNVPVENGGLAVKYSFKGNTLAGLACNVGIKYIGLSYPNSIATDARTGVINPASTVVDAGVSYTWRQGSPKLKHSVKLSVKNGFDRIYYNSNFSPMDRRGFFVAYTVTH